MLSIVALNFLMNGRPKSLPEQGEPFAAFSRPGGWANSTHHQICSIAFVVPVLSISQIVFLALVLTALTGIRLGIGAAIDSLAQGAFRTIMEVICAITWGFATPDGGWSPAFGIV